MVDCIRSAGHTPLQFRIDSAAIVDAALKRLSNGGLLGGLPEPAEAAAVLDSLVLDALAETPERRDLQSSPPRAGEPAAEAAGPIDGAAFRALAAWLERLYTGLRGVDPRAVEILGLRIEGLGDREIAEELELGLRLVRRLVLDMRAAVEPRAGTRNGVDP